MPMFCAVTIKYLFEGLWPLLHTLFSQKQDFVEEGQGIPSSRGRGNIFSGEKQLITIPHCLVARALSGPATIFHPSRKLRNRKLRFLNFLGSQED